MIDWHSHILPGMDDGSRDVTESLSLLKMLAEQGVDTVITTPHFYANNETLDGFLWRRTLTFETLSGSLPKDSPKVLLGAEVRYYQGISRMSDLKRLCIGDTKLLLLEMPMERWTEYTVRELEELSGAGSPKVILAHIDRYLSLQNEGVWERLYQNGILMQVNASFFTEFSTRRKALRLLRNGGIHFMGSDCHNTTSRPPRIGKAFEIIEKKLGVEFLEQISEYGYSMLV